MEGNEVIWGDDEKGLLDAQFALQEAEIMVPDGEAGSSARSEQAEISTRTPSSYQEAIAFERCQQKAARKADAFFHDIICDQKASEPSGTPSSYEEAMALERRSEKKHQTVAKPAKSSGSWAEEWNLLRKCGICGEKGHYRKTCPQNPDCRPRQDRRRKCFKCGSREHPATKCTARTCADCAKAEPLYPVCSALENHRASCCNTCNHLVNQPLVFRCKICKGCVYCSRSHVIQSLCRGCCVRKNIDEVDMKK